MSTVSWNGSEYSEEAFETATRLVMNDASASSRTEVLRRLGRQYGGDRQIYEVLGYPRQIDEEDYRARFERQDIANRVIKLPANDTWREAPTVVDDTRPEDEDEESDFEEAFSRLAKQTRLYHYLRRVDVVSGIGEYGLLFVGFRDSQPLDEEVNESALSGPEDIAFFTPFAQDHVESWILGKDAGMDPTDERYNKPTQYSVDFGDIDDDSDSDIRDVHWTRFIHIAEGKLESDIVGEPRLKPVFNRLIDREKVLGSSAEMFWTGAAPKYQFDIDSNNSADIPDSELDRLDSEVQRLVHDMQQYVKTFNTDIELIDGQQVDPSGIIDQIDKTISGQTGIPKRVLVGSEQAELASTQDRATWFGRVDTRRNRFAEPSVLRPTIDRFVSYGILPQPSNDRYTVHWPNLFELNEVEKSEVMDNRADALKKISPQGSTDLIGTPKELFEFMAEGKNIDFKNQIDPLAVPNRQEELGISPEDGVDGREDIDGV